MTEIILLDKDAVKQLKCPICLKRKAITITKDYYFGNTLICKECIDWLDELNRIQDNMGDEFYKRYPSQAGAFLNLHQIREERRK